MCYLKSFLAFLPLLMLGCGDESAADGGGGSGGLGAAGASEGGASEGGGGASEGGGGATAVDKAKDCASQFGDALSDSFGRLDGTVVAVVAPEDTECPLVNDDHLVLQVAMNGAVYRMVVNITDVAFAQKSAALLGPAWSEGWHTGLTLEYPTDLDVHSPEFQQLALPAMIETISAGIELGAPISVFAVSSGGEFASSAHLIHRNDNNSDGAIVLAPDSENPSYLLFRFASQSF
jgi:hypothetical protein